LESRAFVRVGEVGESEGEESEGGRSALDALDDAARRIAGERREDERFSDAEE